MKIPTDFNEMTISEMQKLMEQGTLSSRRLVEYYLQRIEAIDKSGPELNSILQLNPDVLKIADELDRKREINGKLSMLHGIPILLKGRVPTIWKYFEKF